ALDLLPEKEERLQIVADSMPQLVAFVGDDLRLKLINAQFLQFTNRRGQALLASPLKNVFRENWSKSEPYVTRAFRGETVKFEMTLMRFDGIERTMEIVFIPHKATQKISGLCMVISDITE